MKKIIARTSAIALSLLLLLSGCGTGRETGTSSASAPQKSEEKDDQSQKTEDSTKHSTGPNTEETKKPAQSTDAKPSDDRRTIKDHNGHEVVLPKKLERIVIGSLTPLASVYAMFKGSAEGLVGLHEDSRVAIEKSVMNKIMPDLAKLPSSFSTSGTDDINVEELLKLKPQVYFYNADVKENYEVLKNAGIPAVGFSTTLFKDYSTVDTFNAWIDLLGQVLGEEDKCPGIKAYGEKALELVRGRIEKVPEDKRPKALILANYNENALVAGGTSFANYWIDLAGGKNVGYSVGAFVAPVNMEQIYEWNPEVLYINSFSSYTVEQLLNNQCKPGDDWSSLDAVKNKRVYKIPKGTYFWFPPSSDVPLNVLFMAKTMHPELFEDIDMEKEIKEYFKQQYKYELSDEDVHNILNPTDSGW